MKHTHVCISLGVTMCITYQWLRYPRQNDFWHKRWDLGINEWLNKDPQKLHQFLSSKLYFLCVTLQLHNFPERFAYFHHPDYHGAKDHEMIKFDSCPSMDIWNKWPMVLSDVLSTEPFFPFEELQMMVQLKEEHAIENVTAIFLPRLTSRLPDPTLKRNNHYIHIIMVLATISLRYV